MNILAVETSCDETSVAIIKDGKDVLSNIVVSQIDIHQKYGGVVPEIASRHHIASISLVFEEAIKEANIEKTDIDYVAVTQGPGLIGCLLVGINAAKAFALSNDIPVVGIHHIAGHIYANQLVGEMEFPLIALVVSGGHTELVYMEKHYDFKKIGQTLDDAVGEAYDKVARTLKLSYPGGPVIDKLAAVGKDVYKLPLVLLDKDQYDFSFSGLKSSVINLLHNMNQRNEEYNVEDIATSFQNNVIEILTYKTIKAVKEYNAKTLIIAGGVAANRGLRSRMATEIEQIEGTNLIIPPIKYCTDNAAMIGAAAYYYINSNIYKNDSIIKGSSSFKL